MWHENSIVVLLYNGKFTWQTFCTRMTYYPLDISTIRQITSRCNFGSLIRKLIVDEMLYNNFQNYAIKEHFKKVMIANHEQINNNIMTVYTKMLFILLKNCMWHLSYFICNKFIKNNLWKLELVNFKFNCNLDFFAEGLNCKI